MCNEVKFDTNLKLTKFALKWVLTWRDSFIFKYCNHGKYVKFHLKLKRLHPRAGPSSRHMAIYRCTLLFIRPPPPPQFFLLLHWRNRLKNRVGRLVKKIGSVYNHTCVSFYTQLYSHTLMNMLCIYTIFEEKWNEMKWNEMKWNLLVHIPQITKNYMANHKSYNMFVEGSTEKRSL